jgi:hypothetical protein
LVENEQRSPGGTPFGGSHTILHIVAIANQDETWVTVVYGMHCGDSPFANALRTLVTNTIDVIQRKPGGRSRSCCQIGKNTTSLRRKTEHQTFMFRG